MTTCDEDRERASAAIKGEHRRLYNILDHDPGQAITEARRLQPTADLDSTNVESLRAAVFVDAGDELGDAHTIAEGVEILRRMRAATPELPMIAYNLANGLSALAQATKPEDQPWFLATSDLRREARQLFQQAADGADDYVLRSIRSGAYTNQANLLAQSYRWAEAYDAYKLALSYDPENGIASSGLAKIILGCLKRGLGSKDWLGKLAAKYIRLARSSGARTHEYGGERALRVVESLNLDNQLEINFPDLSQATDYAQFVARHRLALSLTLEGLNPKIEHWDTLVIGSITEEMDAEHGVPPIFAMWNVLKSDFLAARWLAYLASKESVPESGSYSDTLDYANYGVRQSLQTLAQRAAIDVLDKVAVATTEYLEIAGRARSIYFWNRWHETKQGKLCSPRKWQPQIRNEIEHGNTALIALADLAEDIVDGGFLSLKKTLRHSATHRFVVLHEFGSSNNRSNKHVEHYEQTDFELQTIESLQVARSALLYVLEMIGIAEARKGGVAVQMYVPAHHWIRQEDV
ncbi:LA2681 family HEPN domain-containing protein [Acidobacteria bacterium AH-259-D05]|nr:LA2681 family HEPN domain-containing protein [Acidobacteria bacterium AH-259-D05]